MFSINIPAGKFMLTLINCRIWTRCKMYSELKEKHTYRSSALSVIFKQIFYLVPLLSLLAFNNFMPSWVMSQEEELISANCCYTFLLLRSESHTNICEGLLFIKVAQLQYSRFHDNKDMNTQSFLLEISNQKNPVNLLTKPPLSWCFIVALKSLFLVKYRFLVTYILD